MGLDNHYDFYCHCRVSIYYFEASQSETESVHCQQVRESHWIWSQRLYLGRADQEGSTGSARYMLSRKQQSLPCCRWSLLSLLRLRKKKHSSNDSLVDGPQQSSYIITMIMFASMNQERATQTRMSIMQESRRRPLELKNIEKLLKVASLRMEGLVRTACLAQITSTLLIDLPVQRNNTNKHYNRNNRFIEHKKYTAPPLNAVESHEEEAQHSRVGEGK